MNVHDMSGGKEKKQENIIHPLKTADLLRRIHEMEANLFELQKQNEKLEQARAEAEEAYRQYTDLYDFAPVGYFTLGRDGAVHRANLPGAKLLGVDGAQLVNQQLSVFVAEESLPIFIVFFEKLISGSGREICELKFLNDADKPLWV
ncbi:MAG: PAS domain-containing protein, partial [Lewinellaceae bacterium]|nr:PAS domain-containing protein [Lewinellaceae bacterium]